MRRAVRLLAPLFLALLGGCFSLGRETTPLKQYVLGGVPGGEAVAASSDPAALAIGVRRPDLAAYLAPPELVVRHGPHRIERSEFHRWGEDLGEGISRALAGYLMTRGRFRRIDVAPWAPATEHDYRVRARVLRFEGVVPGGGSAHEGEAHVLAVWEIIRTSDGAVVVRGTTDYRESGWRVGDHASLVALLDRGVGRLATDLGNGLASLPAGDPKPLLARQLGVFLESAEIELRPVTDREAAIDWLTGGKR